MKNLKRIAAAALAAVSVLTSFASVSAADFMQPYGYSLPMDKLAVYKDNSAAETELNGENMIQFTGTAAYDAAAKTVKITPNSSSGTTLVMGGQQYGGTTFTEAQSAGKMVTTLRFQLNWSANPNKTFVGDESEGGVGWCEHLDYHHYYRKKGETTDSSLTFKWRYGWNYNGAQTNDSLYFNVNVYGPWGETQSGSIYLGKMYTLVEEFDAINGKISIKMTEDDTGRVVINESANQEITAIRNGAMFRAFSMFDVTLKEFSCYREAFIVKNENIKVDGNNVVASFDVARDGSDHYETLSKTSPVIVLCQYDNKGRVLSRDVQSVSLDAKATSATDNTYKTVTATVEKSKKFDHAKAYIWNNTTDMWAYRAPLELK